MAYTFDAKLMLATAIPLKSVPTSPKLLARRNKRRMRRAVRSF